MIFDITFTIKGLVTEEKEFYMKALMNHIKDEIESELNNAPETIVDSYIKVDLYGKVVQE